MPFDSGAGTAVTEYKGPKSLQRLCDRFGLTLFDRVTKIRVGKIDFEELDLNALSHLQAIKANWAYLTSAQGKWKMVDEHELTKKVKETFSDCQLSLGVDEIHIDRNAVCAIPSSKN